ncbi:3-hydroxyisobutyrate dehydrogenase [Legionella oakridgensis]|uniref:3-hydroxyisobutyrate dehydrogenase n=2 Tax=Legionella oakridgensis TaxID=29423 RepID=W0B5H8_9GAMM|nr:3-hydroxyisobutyrate dehydrogenase [Legionella oakridgensis]AHE65748.1 3-hydroxyisobutyrate dehydrogenase [Legionella oakridgensis ATCC 33761 = DSM 21215]ETO94397.1 3-hydroxyisobutyrate dehydrogenase [Legionella oakridgensis RV-2-2007]KTD38179.1 3-hydroxyisobutyrate dehydrogenase [Legionella oakridgensis]STY15691.1 3-hydroxyisobutyrate dehydrogenase [Legionella longbeachae]
MANIAFIGLGHMGLPMAINLVKAGHVVTGFDLQSQALDALNQAGGNAASSLQEAARNKDIIITMLQTGEQVKGVCLGDGGLFTAAQNHTLFIDCSSIDVLTSRAIHQHAGQHNIQAIDAPVSGGVAGAAAATLTFMVGGPEPYFTRAQPILAHMGKTIIHTGEAGSGQAAKICNNMILGISMIAISEAFTLASHLGLSAKKLHEVVTHSSGQCWAMSRYTPVPGILDNVPANHDYQPGFTAAMMLKDLRLSQQSAETAGIHTPLGHHAMELYQQVKEQGMGELDFSAVIKLISAE